MRRSARRSPRPRPPGGSARRRRSSPAARLRRRPRTALRPRTGAPGRSRPRGKAWACRRRQSLGLSSSRSASSTRLPLRRPGHIRRGRQHERKRPRSGLRLRRRERGVVGGGDLVAHPPRARVSHQPRDRQVLGALDEAPKSLPGVGHPLCAGEQPGVHHHHPRDPVGVIGRQAEADRIAPVVDHDGRLAQVEVREQRRRDLGMAIVRVPVEVDRLVRAPEPWVVGDYAAKARVADRRDDLPPQVRPGRLAVQEDDRGTVTFV
jgi:hypothetical protein